MTPTPARAVRPHAGRGTGVRRERPDWSYAEEPRPSAIRVAPAPRDADRAPVVVRLSSDLVPLLDERARSGHAMELRFLRDTDKREVDFVVLKDRWPLFAVECKSGEHGVSPAIRHFAERTPIPRFYQVHLGERHYDSGTVTVLPFRVLCRELGLP